MPTPKEVVTRWNGRLAVPIPDETADRSGIGEGSEVTLTPLAGGGMLIRSAAEMVIDLEHLLTGITPSNRHGEVDWGRPAGSEHW